MKKILFWTLLAKLYHSVAGEERVCSDPSVLYKNEPINLKWDENVRSDKTYLSADISVGSAKEISLSYIKDVLTPDEMNQFKAICDGRSGWTRSPQRDEDSVETTQTHKARTSSSCPYIWYYKSYTNHLVVLGLCSFYL